MTWRQYVATWLVERWGTRHGVPPDWLLPLVVYTYAQTGERRRIAEVLLQRAMERAKR